jgi:hypothetical protein
MSEKEAESLRPWVLCLDERWSSCDEREKEAEMRER